MTRLSPDDDASLGEIDLFADLHHPVPARAFHCGAYERADVALAEVFLVDKVRSVGSEVGPGDVSHGRQPYIYAWSP